jgi:putative ABC transport system permease protein
MAIGATEGDVQRQFLIEAIVISLHGGAVGIAAGVAASLLIASTAGWPILVSGDAIAGAARLCAGRQREFAAVRQAPRN